MLAEQLQASALLKQQKEAEHAGQAEVEAAPSPVEDKPPRMSEISGNKPKKKHKRQKRKRRSNDEGIRMMICQTNRIEYECQTREKNIRMRKMLAEQGYDYRVQDIPGKGKVVVDYLSRVID